MRCTRSLVSNTDWCYFYTCPSLLRAFSSLTTSHLLDVYTRVGLFKKVRTLVGLVQSCHRLCVNAAERSGDLSGQALDDAVECFGEGMTASLGRQDRALHKGADYLQLPLEQRLSEASSGSDASKPAAAFLTMDLRAFLHQSSPADASAAAREEMDEDENNDAIKVVVRNFLEETLAFVRDHLVSRPLLMAVAAAAERGADSKGESEDEGIQEGFLLLCEVR